MGRKDPNFGKVMDGWSKQAWIHRLRQVAKNCFALRPDLAGYYEAWADKLAAAGTDKESTDGKKLKQKS